MTTFTEGRHPGEGLLSEANPSRSRSNIVIKAGSGLIVPGHVLGQITIGAAVAAAKAGNDGNATISAVTIGSGAEVGVYSVVFTAATAFDVIAPSGVKLASGVTGAAYDGALGFTITVGATPMVAGDGFDITVAAGSGKFAPSPDEVTEGVEGAELASAIAIYGCDATTEDQRISAISRDAEWNVNTLTYDASVDSDVKKAAKAAQLARAGVILR